MRRPDPHCIRFSPDDLCRVRAAAGKGPVSRWARKVLLERANVLTRKALKELPYNTAHGPGKKFTIRLWPAELREIARAAEKEQMRVSAWIRSALVAAARAR